MRPPLPAFLLGLLAVGCALAPKPLAELTPPAVEPLAAMGQEMRVTNQLVLLTDASGTMERSRTFPMAKALTRALVAALPEASVRAVPGAPYRVGITGFGGNERSGARTAPFDRDTLGAAAARLRLLGEEGEHGGETPYRNVFAETARELEDGSGRAAVVLVSDGRPDYRKRAFAAAQQLVQRYDGELCLHTIQVGENRRGGDFLKRLGALSSCGSSSHASALLNVEQLRGFAQQVMFGAATVAAAGDPCGQVVRLQNVEFDFNRYNLQTEGGALLDEIARKLQGCPAVRVRIEGHTDHIGSDAYNQRLSLRRANTVRAYLVREGVAAARLRVRGFGKAQPIASNATDEGRARNRRVELRPENP